MDADVSPNRGNILKYTAICSDQNGISHFKDVTVEFNQANLPHAPTAEVSKGMSATQIFFAKIPQGTSTNLHSADKKQFFCIIEGKIEITVGDGEIRVFGQGDLLFIEDTKGKGHQGIIVGDTDFVAATINVI